MITNPGSTRTQKPTAGRGWLGRIGKTAPARRRRTGIVRRLGLLTAGALFATTLAPISANAAQTLPTASIYVSTVSSRDNAVALNGASITGKAAIFLNTAQSVILDNARFFLDNTNHTTTYYADSSYPFDFNGTVACDLPVCPTSNAILFDTMRLRTGTHTITVAETFLNSLQVSYVTATFQVTRPAGTPPVAFPTPLASGIATSLLDAGHFLYTGTNPLQAGVTDGTITEARAAIISGIVLNGAGSPKANVTVNIVDHPEYGSTVSRADGRFELAVNGGTSLTLRYVSSDTFTVERNVIVDEQSWINAPTVRAINDDNTATLVTPASIPAGSFAVATSGVISDADGSRHSTLFVPSGLHASVVMANGTKRSVSSFNLRQTEFTVGTGGSDAMPASLPASSAYTYAVDLSMDEIRHYNGVGAEFDAPLWHYNENFLNFPTGTTVPAGYYDPTLHKWTASESGRVIRILSETGGTAQVDVNGDGTADSGAALTALSITTGELSKLAQTYASGASLWRVPIRHFSSWDFNWGWGLAKNVWDTVIKGTFNECFTGGGGGGKMPGSSAFLNEADCAAGDTTGSLPLTGVGSLSYDSAATAGNIAAATVKAVVTPSGSVPPTLLGVDVDVQVAGRDHKETLSPAADTLFSWTWDGKDAFGRSMHGSADTILTVCYRYQASYDTTAGFGQPADGTSLSVNSRREISLCESTHRLLFGDPVTDPRDFGLGGWDLADHAALDPRAGTTTVGEHISSTGAYGAVASTLVGTGETGFSGDNGPATQARLNFPGGVAAAPDGTLYVSDTFNDRIRKVAPDGTITTYAGTGSFGYAGDNGPATAAKLASPLELALAPDGALYVADVDNHRVRRIKPDGTISTVAGTGTAGHSGDGGPATSSQLNQPTGLALTGAGDLLIADYADNTVRRIDPTGTITTLAGTGTSGFSGDGDQARAATLRHPAALATNAQGVVYVADSGNNRIRRITPDGVITTAAGGGHGVVNGLLATDAFLKTPVGLAVDSSGNIYESETGTRSVKIITHAGLIRTVAGAGLLTEADGHTSATALRLYHPRSLAFAPDHSLLVVDAATATVRQLHGNGAADGPGGLLVPTEDGTQVLAFNPAGRHVRTYDSLTGVLQETFTYNSQQRLSTVTDQFHNTTTIAYPDSTHTVITSQDGNVTTLLLDANGWLKQLATPGGRTFPVTHASSGLLTQIQDAEHVPTDYTYDADGHVSSITGRDRHLQTVSRTLTTTSLQVDQETAAGQHFITTSTDQPDGSRRQVVSGPTGTIRDTTSYPDGSSRTVMSGLVMTSTITSDPRWGMLRPQIATSTMQRVGQGIAAQTSRTTFTLSDPDNLLSVSTWRHTDTFDGRTWSTDYDAISRKLTKTTPEGRTTVTTLNSDDTVASSQVGNLSAVTYQYDTRGRLTAQAQGTGTSARRSSVEYDAQGFVHTEKDNLQRVTTYATDSDGVTTGFDGPLGHTDLGRNNNATLTSIKPPGVASAYTMPVQADGRPAGFTVPKVGTEPNTYDIEYDDDREISSITLPDGTKLISTLDSAGRLKTVKQGTQTITWTWGSNGRLDHVDSQDAVTRTPAYDSSGLPIGESVSGPFMSSVATTLDSRGQATNDLVNGANSINYEYDEDDLLTNAGPVALTRDASNGSVSTIVAGQSTTTVGHDAFGELSSLSTGGQFGLTFDSRDNGGRITGRHETGALTHNGSYTYDSAGRLQTSAVDGALVTYGYDDSGNLIAQTTGGQTTSATYDAQDRIRTFGTHTYTHNPNGERTQDVDSASRTTNYGWAFGRLHSVDLPDTRHVAYRLDDQGRRVAKYINGQLASGYIWNGDNLVADTDSNGAVVNRYIYAANSTAPDALIHAGTLFRVLYDERGSVRVVSNAATGQVAQAIGYDDWGNVISDTASGWQSLGYAAGLYDPDTGLTHFGAREYDAISHRWLSRDPIGFSGGPNLYAYAGNDPINNVDPSGHDAVGCALQLFALGATFFAPEFAPWAYFILSGYDYSQGRLSDALFNLANAAFGLGALSRGLSAEARAVEEGEGLLGTAAEEGTARDVAGATCSFDSNTQVVMADGTTRLIRDIRIGDKVEAGNPSSGQNEGGRSVTALHRHTDDDLVDITVIGRDHNPYTIHTTAKHPFWDDTSVTWVAAGGLVVGHLLRTIDGHDVPVAAVADRAGASEMLNLTVNGLHTFYIRSGPESVLVHNTCGGVSEEARNITDHSIERSLQPDGGDHYVHGVDRAALSHYVDGVLEGKVPNVVSRYGLRDGRAAFWDPDKGAVVILDGGGGTVFTPQDGKAYFDGLD